MTISLDAPAPVRRGFWMAALAVVAANALLVRWHAAAVPGPVPAWPVVFDLLVLLPVAYLVVHRRRGRGAWLGAAALFSVCLLTTGFLLPAESRGGWWDALSAVRWIAGGAVLALEVVLIGWMLHRARVISRGLDVERAIDTVVAERLGTRAMARLIRMEMRMWLYALWPSKARTDYPGQARFFGHQQQGNASMQLGFLWLMAFEIPLAHLIVHLFSPTGAVVVTLLGLYGFAFMLAEYRATRLRPITVDDDALHIRYGITADLRVPLACITSIAGYRGETRRRPGRMRFIGMGGANIRIQLRPGTRLQGLLGECEVQDLLIGLDEPERFRACLQARIDGSDAAAG